MTIWTLLRRNLFHYWRTNLAVILGVSAATAVIGGALVVGDSVRASLRQMSLDRLGRVDHAIHGPRFFRELLVEELQHSLGGQSSAAPALAMRGTLAFSDKQGQTARAGQINVYGMDRRLWQLLGESGETAPAADTVILNRRVAEQLQVSAGDTVSLIVEIPASIPRDSLLGDREETVTELTLSVMTVLDDSSNAARFGLNPSQQLPLNAFVQLADLQLQTGLAAAPRSKRNPIAKPARVNAIYIGNSSSGDADISRSAANAITDTARNLITMSDLALRTVVDDERGTLSLESEQAIIEKSIGETAIQVANEIDLQTSPVLVYLLNEIWNPDDPDLYSMYSVIAGMDPVVEPPFGPFVFQGEHSPLANNGVYLNEWLAEDLQVASGDVIRVKYHVVGDRGELPEEEQTLTVKGVIELNGAAADPGFTPTVPGVTDAESYEDWSEPFPLKKDRVTDRDDVYLEDHRTTPKVFMALDAAQEIWRSKYGELTSVRVAPRVGQSLRDAQTEFEQALLAKLKPTQTGIIAQPVKEIGLNAAAGTTDFTGLFIGFSFFLILAATILVGLLFRLGIEQRIGEFGLLRAVGLAPDQVRRLFLIEGTLLVTVGGLSGLLAAVGYAAVMIHGLKTWWYGAIGTRFLFLFVTPASLAIGWCIAVLVAGGAIWWALRQTRGHSTRELLSGELIETAAQFAVRGRMAGWLAIVSLGGSTLILLAVLAGVVPDVEAFSGFTLKTVLFFVVGIGYLLGLLTLLAAMLASNRAVPVAGSGTGGQLRLGLRNAARNRSRSVMTASLIGSATFVIIAVAAGQMNPTTSLPTPRSGNGGFSLVAETNVPILNDLNTVEGRAKLGFESLDDADHASLNEVNVAPFRVRPGENASCLNLYQTQLPTILGVPDNVLEEMIASDRFLFADTPGKHPWELLRESLPDGAVPVLGDMNTLMYSLHKGIGSDIPVPNAEQPEHTLRVKGMLANSVFQGVLLMSDKDFQRLFPEQVGFQYFLIECPPEQTARISRTFEAQLGDYGFDAERVGDRLADFLAVQNTYLSTFQTLGGLGLLLGTIGLATVMLRNVLERRGELSLLRAVGFQKPQIAALVACENALLLGWGLFSGTIAALLAMAPHLLSTGSALPVRGIALLLTTVFVIGMGAALLAVWAAVKTPILSTLRGE